MFLAWLMKSFYHYKMFPDALCPQHHLTVHSNQLVSSGKGLATCPRGCSWLMSEAKESVVKSQKLLRLRLHGAVAFNGAKRGEDDCLFPWMLAGQ